jgi:hypothetical protein
LLPHLATLYIMYLIGVMTRREYQISLIVNNPSILKVVIDPHFEAKHTGSIDDQIILRLVQNLSGKLFEPDATEGAFAYFVTDDILLDGKAYKLIWLLEDDSQYIGVVNAFRRKKK